MTKEEEIQQEIIKNFSLKIITIFFIIILVMLGFSYAQQTSTTTVIQENEFVNPLPKDKFVFLEIKEETNQILMYHSRALPSEIDSKSFYVVNMSSGKGIIFTNFNPIDNSEIYYGYVLKTNSLKIPGVVSINKLPCIVSFPDINNEIVNAHKNKEIFGFEAPEKIKRYPYKLILEKIYSNGTVKIKHGKEIITLPIDKEFKNTKILNSYVMNGNEKEPVKLSITIKNDGFIDRKNITLEKLKLR